MASRHCGSLVTAIGSLLALAAACSGPVPTDPSSGGPATSPGPSVASMTLSPGYRTTNTDESIILDASLLDAEGRAISAAPMEWSSVDPALVTVDERGGIHPRQAGVARVAARSGRAADTAIVAVLGERDLLVSVLPGGAVKTRRAPGRAVSVPVTLDLSKVSRSGDLGGIQLDLTYDATLLEYVAARPGLAGAAVVNLVRPGRVRFAFASTDPQGRARVKLLTLHLRVKRGAKTGRTAALGVSILGRPFSTDFEAYRKPRTVVGRIIVAKR
jgi:hypothetical protein